MKGDAEKILEEAKLVPKSKKKGLNQKEEEKNRIVRI